MSRNKNPQYWKAHTSDAQHDYSRIGLDDEQTQIPEFDEQTRLSEFM